jgi:Peptidase S24-like
MTKEAPKVGMGSADEMRQRKVVADRIERVRKSRDLTLKAKYRVDPQTLVQLAKALEVTVGYLAAGHGSARRTKNPFEVANDEGPQVMLLERELPSSLPNVRAGFTQVGMDARETDVSFPVMDADMAPELRPNDRLFIRRDITPRHGETVWVYSRSSETAVFRQYRESSSGGMKVAELHALDRSIPPETVGEDHVIVGVVYLHSHSHPARARKPDKVVEPLPYSLKADEPGEE